MTSCQRAQLKCLKSRNYNGHPPSLNIRSYISRWFAEGLPCNLIHQICRGWLPSEQLKLLHGLSHKHLQAVHDCAASLLGGLHELIQALVKFLPLHCLRVQQSRVAAFTHTDSSSTCCKQSTFMQVGHDSRSP